MSIASRTLIAVIDFLVGFFLLFGGMNLAYHFEMASSGTNQAMGISFMLLGLALFVSAVRVGRKSDVRFRPYVYLLIAIVNTAFLAYQGKSHISHQDFLAWLLIIMVIIICVAAQVLVKRYSASTVRSQPLGSRADPPSGDK